MYQPMICIIQMIPITASAVLKEFRDSLEMPLPARLDPDNEPKRLNIVAPALWVRRIDDWRRKQADLPNLSEAIRRLVEAGLDAERKGRRR